jgi:outer membrane protein OmpA-like peptidoglycan-associated protein
MEMDMNKNKAFGDFFDDGSTPQDRDRRRLLGALLPEAPVEAQRQVLWLSVGVGALVFSGLMGWGPHGRWISGLSATRPVAHRAALSSGVAVTRVSIPTVSIPTVSIPTVSIPGVRAAARKVGAKPAAAIAAVATTAAPTTAAPTTAAPTTAAPTTAAVATTAAPLKLEATIPALTGTSAEPTTAAAKQADPPTTLKPAAASDLAAPTTIAPTESGATGAPDAIVFFTPGSFEIDESGRAVLAPVADTIASLPTGGVVRIIGWASADGGASRNRILSIRRARSVRALLQQMVGKRNAGVAYHLEGWGEGASAANDAIKRRVTVELP